MLDEKCSKLKTFEETVWKKLWRWNWKAKLDW
jgi:hypothetical protein